LNTLTLETQSSTEPNATVEIKVTIVIIACVITDPTKFSSWVYCIPNALQWTDQLEVGKTTDGTHTPAHRVLATGQVVSKLNLCPAVASGPPQKIEVEYSAGATISYPAASAASSCPGITIAAGKHLTRIEWVIKSAEYVAGFRVWDHEGTVYSLGKSPTDGAEYVYQGEEILKGIITGMWGRVDGSNGFNSVAFIVDQTECISNYPFSSITAATKTEFAPTDTGGENISPKLIQVAAVDVAIQTDEWFVDQETYKLTEVTQYLDASNNLNGVTLGFQSKVTYCLKSHTFGTATGTKSE